MRMVLLGLLALAACARHGGTTTMPTMSTASDGYGQWTFGLDLAAIVSGNSLMRATDHADDDHAKLAVESWAFAYGAGEAAIHYEHGNALGAALGPTLKLGGGYVLIRVLGEHHPVVAAFAYLGIMIVDAAVIAR